MEAGAAGEGQQSGESVSGGKVKSRLNTGGESVSFSYINSVDLN